MSIDRKLTHKKNIRNKTEDHPIKLIPLVEIGSINKALIFCTKYVTFTITEMNIKSMTVVTLSRFNAPTINITETNTIKPIEVSTVKEQLKVLFNALTLSNCPKLLIMRKKRINSIILKTELPKKLNRSEALDGV